MDLPRGRMPGATSCSAMFFRSSVSVDTACLLTVEVNASVKLGVGSSPACVRAAPCARTPVGRALTAPRTALRPARGRMAGVRLAEGAFAGGVLPCAPAGEYRQAVCATRATLAAPRGLGRQRTNRLVVAVESHWPHPR